MLSLQTAKKLKDAGLEWEPNLGDFYYKTPFAKPSLLDNAMINSIKESIFVPRLDQLLREIHKRKCRCYWESNQLCSVYLIWNVHEESKVFTSKVLEDAVANALLWLMLRSKNSPAESSTKGGSGNRSKELLPCQLQLSAGRDGV